MEAKELRIGNLYYYTAHLCKEVSEIDDAYSLYLLQENDMKDCEPIPLTEEWLLRFGFEDRFVIEAYIKGDIIVREDYKIGIHDGLHNNTFIKDMEYVHQLQNLYFALTEEELELLNK